jgi:hypothetical protein
MPKREKKEKKEKKEGEEGEEGKPDQHEQPQVKPEKRKRGRKPRGGKVVGEPVAIATAAEMSRNVILHLSCTTQDLDHLETDVEAHEGQDQDQGSLLLNTPMGFECGTACDAHLGESKTGHELWEKVKSLNDVLHRSTGLGKSSDCFWCTCAFNTPPVHIPRSVHKESIECYGCFCSPECALAFLMKEGVDGSQTWERVALLNTIYGAVFSYKRSIRPAPPPFYLLDKYYGSMTIEEYRELLGSDKRLIVVDKPLTRSVPHLFDDHDEMCDPSLIPMNKNAILKTAFGCA